MRLALATACLAGIALPVNADSDDYYYGGLQLGLTQSPNQTLRGRANNTLNVEDDKSLGPVAGAFFGRNIGKWRYELEYAYRRNSYSDLNVRDAATLPLAPGAFDAEGEQQSNSFMINGHYQFAGGTDWKALAGLGIGVTRMKIEEFRTAAGTLVADSRDWEPAGQAMVQFAKSFGEHTEFGLGFRHFRSLSGKFGTEARGARYKFVNNEIFARFSFKFGETSRPAPQPAPRPAPAPAPVVKPAPQPAPAPAPEPKPVPIPGPFMVFFDFDSTVITDDAASIIKRAAEAYKKFGIVSINATGHADRSGADAYNDKLAQRRADIVKARLIDEGVPASRISVSGEGEGSPLVATGDGVREWQNRRVEIVLKR
ncbi:OmpA family protein [Kordiimonas aquimaris]|uniref:OmpA family protein n=1 Tax=Kordiimonas aquimaris TaxID=707591 RepID=UPI0021D309D6|nr:OmpA family protein [Kordiimonas aquimaris]